MYNKYPMEYYVFYYIHPQIPIYKLVLRNINSNIIRVNNCFIRLLILKYKIKFTLNIII